MAEIPFVDTHVHYYDLKNPELFYSWLQPDWADPDFGDFDALKAPRYDSVAYRAETRFANVSKVVHVQAAIGIEDPVRETEWLQELTHRTGYPQAIVAHVDLAAASAEFELERHLAYPAVRGVRDFGRGDYLGDPRWRRGVGLLTRFGLVLDLDCDWSRMGVARDVARASDGVSVVLDHAGFPTARTEDYRREWQSGLRLLAEADNAHCKISGLGSRDPHWTVDSMRPWVLDCIEIFGVDRCVFGTNWPIDRLYSSYDPLVAAYAEIIGDFTMDEQAALFHRNAERLYRI